MLLPDYLTPVSLRKLKAKRRYQFGGSTDLLDYYKDLLPKVQGYMGTSGGNSNLYSDEAQDYYRGLLRRNEIIGSNIRGNRNNIVIPGNFGSTYDPNGEVGYAYTQHIWDQNYGGQDNKPLWDDLSARQQKNLVENNKYKSGEWFDGENFVVPELSSNQDADLFRQDQVSKSNVDKYTKRGMESALETGANIFSLAEGQRKYDAKPKEKLNEVTGGNFGIKYQRGGVPQHSLGSFLNKVTPKFVRKGINKAVDIGKGGLDTGLSGFGLGNVFQDTWHDNSKFLSGFSDLRNKAGRVAASTTLGPLAQPIFGAVDYANNKMGENTPQKYSYEAPDLNMNRLQSLMGLMGYQLGGATSPTRISPNKIQALEMASQQNQSLDPDISEKVKNWWYNDSIGTPNTKKQKGGVVSPKGDPWEYMMGSDGEVMTRKKGSDKWIKTSGKAKEAILSNIFESSPEVQTEPVQQIPIEQIVNPVDSNRSYEIQETIDPNLVSASSEDGFIGPQIPEGYENTNSYSPSQIVMSQDSISGRTNNPFNISDRWKSWEDAGLISGGENPIDGDAKLTGFVSPEVGTAAFYAKVNNHRKKDYKGPYDTSNIKAYQSKYATSPHAWSNFKSIAKKYGADITEDMSLEETIEAVGGMDNFARIMLQKENAETARSFEDQGVFNRVNQENYSDFLQKTQKGGSVIPNLINTTGYKTGTSTYNNPFNIIPGGDITMKGVDTPVLANPSVGSPKVMMPGEDYKFPGASYVVEQKLNQFKKGGKMMNPFYEREISEFDQYFGVPKMKRGSYAGGRRREDRSKTKQERKERRNLRRKGRRRKRNIRKSRRLYDRFGDLAFDKAYDEHGYLRLDADGNIYEFDGDSEIDPNDSSDESYSQNKNSNDKSEKSEKSKRIESTQDLIKDIKEKTIPDLGEDPWGDLSKSLIPELKVIEPENYVTIDGKNPRPDDWMKDFMIAEPKPKSNYGLSEDEIKKIQSVYTDRDEYDEIVKKHNLTDSQIIEIQRRDGPPTFYGDAVYNNMNPLSNLSAALETSATIPLGPFINKLLGRVRYLPILKGLPSGAKPALGAPIKNLPGGSPGLPMPGLPSPGLPSPGLPSPGLPSPGLPSPGLPSVGQSTAARYLPSGFQYGGFSTMIPIAFRNSLPDKDKYKDNFLNYYLSGGRVNRRY